MREKLKRVCIGIGIFVSGIHAGLTLLFFRKPRGNTKTEFPETTETAELKAALKKEEVKYEIEETPATVLVDTAPNHESLRTEQQRIADGAKGRLQDRARKILSRDAVAGYEMQAAEAEIDAVAKEAYEAGYKAALLKTAPETAYYQSLAESLKRELETEKKKLLKTRLAAGAIGLAAGALGASVLSIAIRK